MDAMTGTHISAISKERVRDYGDAVGDHNPIHFDEAFAQAAGLPTTVIHGHLTSALILDAIVGQIGADAILNLDVRLRAPTFPGDALVVLPTAYGVSVQKADGTVAATGVLITTEDEA